MTAKQILRKIDQEGERWLTLPLYTMVVLTVFMEVIRRFFLSYSFLFRQMRKYCLRLLDNVERVNRAIRKSLPPSDS